MDGYHDIRELKLMTRVAFQIGVVLRLFFGTTAFLAMSVAGAGDCNPHRSGFVLE